MLQIMFRNVIALIEILRGCFHCTDNSNIATHLMCPSQALEAKSQVFFSTALTAGNTKCAAHSST